MSTRPSREERRKAAQQQTEMTTNMNPNGSNAGGNAKYLLKSMKDDYPDLEYFSSHLLVDEVSRFAPVPFPVTNPQYPGYDKLVAVGDFREDTIMHLSYHRGVGPNNSDIICPKATWGKPCPICEELIEKTSTSYAEQNEFIKATDDGKGNNPRAFYKVKRKDVMNVWSYERNKIELWAVATWYFFEDFQKELKSNKNNPAVHNFILSDPEFGPDIEVTPDAPTGKKARRSDKAKINPGTVYPGKMRRIDLFERKVPLSDEILDMAIPLDKYITVLSYDDIRTEMYGMEDEDDDTEYVSKETKATPTEATPTEVEDTFVEEEPVKEEAPVEETPTRERGSRRKSTPTTVCPKGHNCATEFDTFEDCNSCTDAEYDACEKAFNEAQA